MKEKIPDEIAPCGIYCSAYPAFGSSCLGCHSSDKGQRRISKWKCKIRTCALQSKQVEFCTYCNEFPCRALEEFADSHKDDQRYKYRTEIFDNLVSLKEDGVKRCKKDLANRWHCPECGGVISFYYYRCKDCGNEKAV